MGPMFVCSAPALTYETDLIPAELNTEVSDALRIDPARFGIRTRQFLFSTSRYQWPDATPSFVEQDAFTDRVGSFYAMISARACPASVLVEIENAVIARNMIYCSDGHERRRLYETARPGDRDATDEAHHSDLDAADRTRFGRTRWTALYLGSVGSFNYGHWLVDDLPRAKAAMALMHTTSRPVRILLPSYGDAINQVRTESLRLMLRKPIPIEFVDPNRAWLVPRLHYATPVTEHPVSKSPIAMDYVAREVVSARYAEQGVNRDGLTRRIVVRRGYAHSRHLANEDEIVDRLTSAGFEVVEPAKMTFAEQVDAFAQASVVVGTMGAAMTNCLFCRPQTFVFHLAPRGWIEPFFFDLAVVRGHHYRVLYGDPIDASLAPHLSDFTIAPAPLLSALGL